MENKVASASHLAINSKIYKFHGLQLNLICGGGEFRACQTWSKKASDLQIKSAQPSGGSILAQHAAEALKSRELRVAVDAARRLFPRSFMCRPFLLMDEMCCFALQRLRNGRTLGRCRFCSWHSLSESSLQQCYGMLCLCLLAQFELILLIDDYR